MTREDLDGPDAFVIHDFLSPAECDEFVARSESVGFGDAPISTGRGFVIRKDYRNNERVMIDDPELAARLWERAGPLVPPRILVWRACGLNERFRYYRYDPGQRFAVHADGYYERPNGERSHLTVLLYLNDGFTGGETVIYRRDDLRVVPRRGMALLFRHGFLHEGAPVLSGRKYVLRTDVMYRIEPASG
jgi:hypothetical protein